MVRSRADARRSIRRRTPQAAAADSTAIASQATVVPMAGSDGAGHGNCHSTAPRSSNQSQPVWAAIAETTMAATRGDDRRRNANVDGGRGRHDHRELGNLDPGIEGDQRRQQVRAGELQPLAQREREAEPVHQAEPRRHGPAASERPRSRAVGARRPRVLDDVLERHPHDRDGNQGLDQRREPERRWRQAVGRGDERARVREGERGDDDHERPDPAQRDGDAQQEEQVIGTAQHVADPGAQERQRSLVPARVELDDTGIAVPLIRAHRAIGGDQAQHGRHALPEPPEVRVDRQTPRGALARVVDARVERALFPQQLQARIERRPGQLGARRLEALERAVGRQRQPHGGQLAGPQAAAVLENVDGLEQPHRRGVPQRRIDASQIDVPGPAGRHVHVAHRGEWDAHEQRDAVRLRPQERLHRNVVGNVVGGGRAAENEQDRGHGREDAHADGDRRQGERIIARRGGPDRLASREHGERRPFGVSSTSSGPAGSAASRPAATVWAMAPSTICGSAPAGCSRCSISSVN